MGDPGMQEGKVAFSFAKVILRAFCLRRHNNGVKQCLCTCAVGGRQDNIVRKASQPVIRKKLDCIPLVVVLGHGMWTNG
jgi:hypothetical protein